MKASALWQRFLGSASPREVFDFLVSSLNESICIWDWFVNWNKVYKNVAELEIDLNTFNFVAGSEAPEEQMRTLLTREPRLMRVIPILLACRLETFLILTKFADGNMMPEAFAFTFTAQPTIEQIDGALRFARETGVCEMLKRIKSVPDYVMGVEVGLDSNGRKNRTGSSMETIVGGLLHTICEEHAFKLMKQATPRRIRDAFGKDVRLASADRAFDFAVLANNQLFLLEANYYSGGGTKLKSTAGEFTRLFDTVNAQGHEFIWITDGQGWHTTRGPLRDAFDHIDYILNLKMVGLGILEAILTEP